MTAMSPECQDDMTVEGDENDSETETRTQDPRRSPLDLRRSEDPPPSERFPFSISSLLQRREAEEHHETDSEGSTQRKEAASGEEEEEDRAFQPYTFTHNPFVGSLLPHLGLLPPISAAAVAAGLNSQSHFSLTNPGSVIRVPAHRPGGAGQGGLAGILPQMNGALPWLSGLTPLERTAAVAHQLSALAPLAGELSDAFKYSHR